eukprot:gene3083-3278_t
MTVKNTGLQVSVGSGVQSFLNNLMNNVRQRLNSDSFNNENNLCLDGVPLKQQLKQEASENNDLFDLSILFAAPKKKVSPRRKRRKHFRYFPDPIAWSRCDRCGEPKRPHRICHNNADICFMRPEEYQQHLAKVKSSEDKNDQQ